MGEPFSGTRYWLSSLESLGESLVRVDGAGGPACTILPQAVFFVDLAA
jgi:hypothetical protein